MYVKTNVCVGSFLRALLGPEDSHGFHSESGGGMAALDQACSWRVVPYKPGRDHHKPFEQVSPSPRTWWVERTSLVNLVLPVTAPSLLAY